MELLSLQLMLLVLESIGNYDAILPALDSRDDKVGKTLLCFKYMSIS